MLERLLKLLKEGTYTLNELSEKLLEPVEEVKAQLEYLETINRIKRVPIEVRCNNDCKGCTSKCIIFQENNKYIWRLS